MLLYGITATPVLLALMACFDTPLTAPVPQAASQPDVVGVFKPDHVLDRDTGEPLVGAAIRIIRIADSAQVPVMIRTDAAGRYVLPSLPPGNYRLTALRIGYNRESLELTVPALWRPGFSLQKSPLELDCNLTFGAIVPR